MITIVHRGNFNNTDAFLKRNKKMQIMRTLEHYGEEGVKALSENTPKDSGATAAAWGYEVKETRNGYSIYWTNSNVNQGLPIAILIQYGHGTGTGGYVQGRDFINPAIQPVFDDIAETVWKEVTK